MSIAPVANLSGKLIFPNPKRVAAAPIARRFDLDPPESMLPDTDRVGSIRIERIVYISRIMGSRRGPPMKGDDSGCEKSKWQ